MGVTAWGGRSAVSPHCCRHELHSPCKRQPVAAAEAPVPVMDAATVSRRAVVEFQRQLLSSAIDDVISRPSHQIASSVLSRA